MPDVVQDVTLNDHLVTIFKSSVHTGRTEFTSCSSDSCIMWCLYVETLMWVFVCKICVPLSIYGICLFLEILLQISYYGTKKIVSRNRSMPYRFSEHCRTRKMWKVWWKNECVINSNPRLITVLAVREKCLCITDLQNTDKGC